MKHYKIFLAVFVIIFMFTGCDYVDDRLIINNKSNDTIIFVTFPDTFIRYEKLYIDLNQLEYYVKEKVLPQKKRRSFNSEYNGWSKYIKWSTNKRLNLFIFTMDTIQKYKNDWYSIVKNKRHVKSYHLTEEELDKMNWEVVYE